MSGLQPRQHELSCPPPDLPTYGLPEMIEAHIGATAESGRSGNVGLQLDIDVKNALQRFHAFRVAWIDGQHPPSGSPQCLARQVIASGRYFADDPRRPALVQSFRQLDRGAPKPISNEITVILSDRRAHDPRASRQHVADQLAFLEIATRKVLRI